MNVNKVTLFLFFVLWVLHLCYNTIYTCNLKRSSKTKQRKKIELSRILRNARRR